MLVPWSSEHSSSPPVPSPLDPVGASRRRRLSVELAKSYQGANGVQRWMCHRNRKSPWAPLFRHAHQHAWARCSGLSDQGKSACAKIRREIARAPPAETLKQRVALPPRESPECMARAPSGGVEGRFDRNSASGRPPGSIGGGFFSRWLKCVPPGIEIGPGTAGTLILLCAFSVRRPMCMCGAISFTGGRILWRFTFSGS